MMIKNRAIMFVSVLIALSVAVCAFAFSDDVSAESTFGGGAGTESSPYLISSVAHLQQLATDVNGGTDYSGKYFLMTEDISMVDESWTPIGTLDNPFKGKFDGGNHSIIGLKITRNVSTGETTGTKMYQGLFGATSSDAAIDNVMNGSELDTDKIKTWSGSSAVLKNIVFENVSISVQGQVAGALVGKATNTYIYNIEVRSGSIKTLGNSGGVVGFISGSVVDNVTTQSGYKVGAGTEGGYSIGGIVGAVRDTGNSAVINSTNNSEVKVILTGAGSGGILGNIADTPASTTIYNCINNGNVSISEIKTEKTDYITNTATGIVGGSNGQLSTSIIKCTNNGRISNDSTFKAGALAGITKYTAGVLRDCVNNGQITGDAYIRSGIISQNYMELKISGCENKGTVSTSGDAIVADVIGYNGGGLVIEAMELDSADEVEKYIPTKVGFAITFNGVSCPEGCIIEYNPSEVGDNIKITLQKSFAGSTFKICMGNGVEVHADTVGTVSFAGNITGTTSVHSDDGVGVTVPAGYELTRFYLFGKNNTVVLSGKFTEGVTIGRYDNESNKNTITIAEGSQITQHSLLVYGDENKVYVSGRVNNSTSNHGMSVVGDKNEIVIKETGFINHFLSVNGTDNKIDNFGQIMKIEFVGTGKIVNEKDGKIKGTATEYNGHKISVGTSSGSYYVSTDVIIHNYGLIEGLNDDSSFSYIFYTAGFDKVTWYNYEGSKINQTCYLFCFQQKGSDGSGTMRGTCNMNFYYAEGTVVKDDTPVTINDSTFAKSSQGTVAKYGLLKSVILDYDYEVTGTEDKEITVLEGVEFSLDTLTKEGYKFYGWYGGETKYSDGGAITVSNIPNFPSLLKAKIIKQITVTTDINGSVTTETYDEGSTVTKPADPEINGYIFGGWYVGDSKWDFDTPLTEDITIKAKMIVDSGKIVIPYGGGDVDFKIPAAPAATEIAIELPSDVKVTLGKDTITSAAGKTITATVSKLTSEMFEITVEEDGVTMNRTMNITLPYTSSKGTPSVYYYPGGGSEVLMSSTIDTASSTITFTTNHNSVYGIVYAPAPTPTPTPTPTPGGGGSTTIRIASSADSGIDADAGFVIAIVTLVFSLLLLAYVIRKN